MSVKTFCVYNELGAYDPITNTYDPIWNGEQNIHAEIVVNKGFDFVTQEYIYEVTTLPLAVKTDIDVTGYESITLKVNTIGEYQVSEVWSRYIPDPLPFILPSLEFEYELSDDDINGFYDDSSWFKIVTQDKGIEPIPTHKSISNQYLLSDEQVKAFKNELYSIIAYENVDNDQFKTIDFIGGLRIYPFIIPEINILGNEEIEIREYKLETQGSLLNTDHINLNMGIIEVPSKYNNALDFKDVQADLYLPFFSGSISVNPRYLIGNSVSIIVNILIESGTATINLLNNTTGEIYNISSSALGSDYPLFSANRVDNVNYKPSQAINDIRQAYIIVQSPNYDSAEMWAIKSGTLAGEQGKIRVIDMQLSNIATLQEKDRILSLVQQGIFIK